MIIRNDNITEATIAETTFDPTTFANLADFWVSDYGVNNTGNVLNSWTGKVNGNVFSPINSGQTAAYSSSDSDFNNYPSLVVNTVQPGFKCVIPNGPSNRSMIMVGKITTRTATNVVFWMGVNKSGQTDVNLRFCHDETTTAFATWTYGTPDGSPTFQSLNTISTDGSYFLGMMSYQVPTRTFDIFSSNTSALQKTRTYTGRWDGFSVPNPIEFDIVAWGGVADTGGGTKPYGNSSLFKFVEIVVIDGAPTSQELTSYTSYLNKRYGI